jgi:putative transposase
MNRGRRTGKIFSDEQDYLMFTELLKETSGIWNIRIAAFCLMPNRYHMLVQTPEANISRSMRHLNGVYTQRYNRRHNCDGKLFRGRYKSILIDTPSYLLQAVRYIHRNPLQSGLADRLDAYKGSSHKGYVSMARKWDWLHKDYILSLLSKIRKDRLRYYRKWVSVEEKDKVTETFNRKKWPLCLGPQSFVARIKETYGTAKTHKAVPSSRKLLPDNHRILEVVCKSYDVTASDILKMRRGKMNEARNVAIYLTRRLRRDTFKDIGAQFGIGNDSTVSSVMERMKRKLAGDRKFSLRLDNIAESISKQVNK